MLTETALQELTEVQWQVAYAIAQQLVIEGTDVNELRKTISYLREYVDQENAGKTFFDYLEILVRRGDQIGHSKQTISYYRSLNAACEKHLKDYQNEASLMLIILGWAARLVKYYKSFPVGEIQLIEVMSEREAAIQAVTQTHTFEIGQKIEAIVTAIKGNKVTYELFGVIKLTQRKPKRSKDLNLNQVVQVEISELREDGTLKKVKPIS